MTNTTDPTMNLGTMLAPVQERHAALLRRRDELAAQLEAVRDEILVFERVLKAGGVMEREQRTPQTTKKKTDRTYTSSPGLMKRVLEYVNGQDEVVTKQVADALGNSTSAVGKALSELRADGQIRLVRREPSSADGRGYRPVYGPWKGVDDE